MHDELLLYCTIRGTSSKHRHSDYRAEVHIRSDPAPSGETGGEVAKMSKGALKFAASAVSQTIFLTGTKNTVESDQHSWARKSKCAVPLSIRYMWFVPREYEWHPPVPCWGPVLFTLPVSFSFDPIVSLQSLGETCACISPIRQKASVRGSHPNPEGVPKSLRESGRLPLLPEAKACLHVAFSRSSQA